jgi:hypothetical protein
LVRLIKNGRRAPISNSPKCGETRIAKLFEHDRHGPVVDELDRHPRAEDARFDGDAVVAQRCAEAVVQRFRELWRRGVGKARTVPLARVLSLSEVNRKIERER